ncbi:hypothetical protein B7463_g11986, partial [Scytalidium lignicola]
MLGFRRISHAEHTEKERRDRKTERRRFRIFEVISPPSHHAAIIWAGVAIATTFIALRGFLRVKYYGRFQLDDFFAVFAYLLLIALAVLYTLGHKDLFYVLRIAAGQLSPPTTEAGLQDLIVKSEFVLKQSFASMICFWSCLWTVKASFLTFFYPLREGLTWDRRLWYTVVVFVSLSYITIIIDFPLTCGNVENNFKFQACNSARNIQLEQLSLRMSTALDILTDVSIIIIPWKITFIVQKSTKEKLATGSIISLSVFIILFAIIRVIVTNTSYTSPEPIWLELWSTIETTVAVTVISLTSLRVFMARVAALGSYDSRVLSGRAPRSTHEPSIWSSRVQRSRDGVITLDDVSQAGPEVQFGARRYRQVSNSSRASLLRKKDYGNKGTFETSNLEKATKGDIQEKLSQGHAAHMPTDDHRDTLTNMNNIAVFEEILAPHMVAISHNLCSIFILYTVSFPSDSVQANDASGINSLANAKRASQSPSKIGANDLPICLHRVGQCPTAPKPGCSDEYCQGPHHICPTQFRCVATTAFSLEDREVTLTGCHCCPLPLFVRCLNYDCRAPTGTRQCVSEKLEGCACETDEDRAERFYSEFRVQDIPVLAENEVEQDVIEVNDDGLLDAESMMQSQSDTTRTDVSSHLYWTGQEHERYTTSVMARPTIGFGLWYLYSC